MRSATTATLSGGTGRVISTTNRCSLTPPAFPLRSILPTAWLLRVCYHSVQMKLILAIVQDADAARLQEALSEQGLQSTKLASTGGFLREGNTTVLIGVDDHKVPKVKEIIHNTCRERTKVVTAGSPIHALEGIFASQPMEVPVGGAIVFVLSTDSFERL